MLRGVQHRAGNHRAPSTLIKQYHFGLQPIDNIINQSRRQQSTYKHPNVFIPSHYFIAIETNETLHRNSHGIPHLQVVRTLNPSPIAQNHSVPSDVYYVALVHTRNHSASIDHLTKRTPMTERHYCVREPPRNANRSYYKT